MTDCDPKRPVGDHHDTIINSSGISVTDLLMFDVATWLVRSSKMSHRYSSQNRMRHIFFCAALIACLGACGGGGKSNDPGPPQPVDPQSSGGIWFDPNARGGLAFFWIAENGELRTQLHLDGATGASFGAGTVSVTLNNVLSGSFELAGGRMPPTNQRGEDLGCSISGTVLERQTLSVDVTCADSNGVVYDETLAMMYDGSIYERGSSLDAIAGNYTLTFQPNTNSLSISDDGTITGMYHNGGARCNVNGTAAIIDADYTLIDIGWTMSNCLDPLLNNDYEGVQVSGYAMEIQAPTGASGSYFFLLTGRVGGSVYSISVHYDRI